MLKCCKGDGDLAATHVIDRLQTSRCRVSPRSYLGLALYWAWGYACFHMPSLLNNDQGNEVLNLGYLLSLLGSATVFSLSLAVRCLAGERVERAMSSRHSLLVSSVLGSLSTGTFHLLMGAPAALAAAFFTGVGMGAVPLGWGYYYGRSNSSLVKAAVPSAGIITTLIVILLHFVPRWLQTAVSVTLPLFMVWLAPPKPGYCLPASNSSERQPKVVKALVPFFISVLAFGISFGFFRGMQFEGIGGKPLLGSIVFFIGMNAGYALALTVNNVRPQGVRLSSFYKVALPVTVGSLLLLGIGHPLAPYISAAGQGVGFVLYDIVTWVVVSEIALQTRLSAFILAGIARLASHAGMLLGGLLGTGVSAGGGAESWSCTCPCCPGTGGFGNAVLG